MVNTKIISNALFLLSYQPIVRKLVNGICLDLLLLQRMSLTLQDLHPMQLELAAVCNCYHLASPPNISLPSLHLIKVMKFA